MIIELEELVKNGEIEIKTGPFGTQLKAAEYVEGKIPVCTVIVFKCSAFTEA